MIFAVRANGSLYCGDTMPANSVQVDEGYYDWLQENLSFLNLSIQNGHLNVTVDLAAYRRAALAKVKLDDFVKLDDMKIFDFEVALIREVGSPVFLRNGIYHGTARAVADLINRRNSIYLATISAINEAVSPIEVDDALGKFEKWQTI